MPAVRRAPLIELFWRAHRTVFRASGGRIVSRVGPLPRTARQIAVALLEPL